MVPIYKKKVLSKEEYRDILVDLYVNRGKTHAQISEMLSVHRDTVERHCREFGIKSRDRNEYAKRKVKRTSLSQNQIEIFNGIMLSDGCLFARDSNISARLTLGYKYIKTLDDIINKLSCFKFSPIWKSEQTRCFHVKSHSYKDLRYLYNEWYQYGCKIVLKSIFLTPLTCLYWFMGDGYGENFSLIFSTDSFTEEENNMLSLKLNDLGFDSYVTARNRIRIRSASVTNMIDWMQSKVPILKHYKYKFDYKFTEVL